MSKEVADKVVEEQVTETTVNETTAGEDEVVETTQSAFKVFDVEEEYNKTIQSERSKAKGELLKEIGYKSVAEIKEAIDKGLASEEQIQQLSGVAEERDNLKVQVKNYEDKELLKTVGIPEENAEMFLKLLEAEQGDEPREEKALKLKEQLAKLGVSVTVGSRKTKEDLKTDDDVMKEMRNL